MQPPGQTPAWRHALRGAFPPQPSEPSNEAFDRELRRRDSRCGLRCLDAVIRVEEFADVETLRAVGLDDPWNLTGLYQGHPLSEQSIWSSGGLPPIISLFRSPLLNELIRTGVALEDLVTHVTVHEVGHHFGLSDDQMQAIENDRF